MDRFAVKYMVRQSKELCNIRLIFTFLCTLGSHREFENSYMVQILQKENILKHFVCFGLFLLFKPCVQKSYYNFV